MYDLLGRVNSPADLKDLSTQDLEALCSEIRAYIIQCCSINPGHIGSSLGAVEIAVALHKVFNTPEDKIVWDVGHQAYAHKIITGRRDQFRHNRELGGISGFPKREESDYDPFGTGHASTSISAALGMAVAAEMKGLKNHHIAVIGDGALSGGLAFEGLNNAGSLKTDLLVILNDNQISIDQNIGGMHNYLLRITTSTGYNKLKADIWDKLGSRPLRKYIQKIVKQAKRRLTKDSDALSLFDSLGLRYFGPIDGNDIALMTETLERLKNISGPRILHVITTKGKGFKPAEENQTIWHSPGKFDPDTGERLAGAEEGPSRYQDVFGETITELARKNKKIIGITPAMLTGSSLNIMKREMPDRVYDVGIAEGHAVTFAAGLAAEGMLPVCNIYSTFMQRAYDNLVHDVALQGLKVIFCLDRAGIVGEDGATHHGVFDLAYCRSVPGIAIASPRNELELRNLLYSATCEDYPSIIIRYPRGKGYGTEWKGVDFSKICLGEAVKLAGDDSGNYDCAILSIGPIASRCTEAIAECGRNVLHYDMRFLKPIDERALEEICDSCQRIITVEDGTTIGGLHGAVAEYITSHRLGNTVTALGVPDSFIGQGTPEQLHQMCGYSKSDILSAINSVCDIG